MVRKMKIVRVYPWKTMKAQLDKPPNVERGATAQGRGRPSRLNVRIQFLQ